MNPEPKNARYANAARSVPRIAAAVMTAIVAAATAVGCGVARPVIPEAGAPPRVFVGDVSGTDVRVAVVATPNRARIYFCGGAASYATATKWLLARIDSSQHLEATAAEGAWYLEASIDRAFVEGAVVLGDSTRHPFQAAAVAKGTIAGLYEANASCSSEGTGKIGLIVAQATRSSEPIGQGACIDDHSATVLQVNPIRPIAADAEGAIAVTTAGSEPALTRPAAPPAD